MPAPVIWITAVVLNLGAAPVPYGFYTLLRIVATAAFVWAAVTAHERGQKNTPWICLLLAVLFNPFIRIVLPRHVWAVLDLGAAAYLLLISRSIRARS